MLVRKNKSIHVKVVAVKYPKVHKNSKVMTGDANMHKHFFYLSEILTHLLIERSESGI